MGRVDDEFRRLAGTGTDDAPVDVTSDAGEERGIGNVDCDPSAFSRNPEQGWVYRHEGLYYLLGSAEGDYEGFDPSLCVPGRKVHLYVWNGTRFADVQYRRQIGEKIERTADNVGWMLSYNRSEFKVPDGRSLDEVAAALGALKSVDARSGRYRWIFPDDASVIVVDPKSRTWDFGYNAVGCFCRKSEGHGPGCAQGQGVNLFEGGCGQDRG